MANISLVFIDSLGLCETGLLSRCVCALFSSSNRGNWNFGGFSQDLVVRIYSIKFILKGLAVISDKSFVIINSLALGILSLFISFVFSN
jgi:hypothetical protein